MLNLSYAVAKKFYVNEDPRIALIEELLPGANCGGCGRSGCHDFACVGTIYRHFITDAELIGCRYSNVNNIPIIFIVLVRFAKRVYRT